MSRPPEHVLSRACALLPSRLENALERRAIGLSELLAAAWMNQGPFLTGLLIQMLHEGRPQGSGTSSSKGGRRLRSAGVRDSISHVIASSRHATWPRRETPRDSRGRAVFASFQPNSTRALMPVASQRAKDNSVFLLDPLDRRSIELCDHHGVRWHPLPLSLEPGGLLRLGQDVVAAMQSVSLPLVSSLVTEVSSDWGTFSAAEVHRIRRGLLRQVLKALVFCHRLQRAFLILEPAALVYSTHRAMVHRIAERHSNIEKKILFIQGVIPDMPPARTRLKLDSALVGSALELDYLERCGVPRDRVCVLGYPEYDAIHELNREECRRKLHGGLPRANGRPVVVHTSQYKTSLFSEQSRIAQLQGVAEAARRCPKWFFVLRPHPRKERISPEMILEFPENLVVHDQLSSLEAIAGADAMSTYWSTTALEAALVGTPLIQFNITGLPDFFPLVERWGGQCVHSVEDFVEQLRRIEDSGDAQAEHQTRALGELGCRVDGLATHRVARELDLILGALS